jgi:predicted MarR family transcription regulator
MTTPTTEPEQPTRTDEDHFWHLARSRTGVAMTDFEFALMRTAESFARWQSECLAAVTGAQLSGAENAMLHVICMHAQPKTVRELMHMINRSDLPNVQYGLRKLMQLGFVTKSGSAQRVFYAGTPQGIEVCEAYARLREKCCCAAPRRCRNSSPKPGRCTASSRNWSACTSRSAARWRPTTAEA